MCATRNGSCAVLCRFYFHFCVFDNRFEKKFVEVNISHKIEFCDNFGWKGTERKNIRVRIQKKERKKNHLYELILQVHLCLIENMHKIIVNTNLQNQEP